MANAGEIVKEYGQIPSQESKKITQMPSLEVVGRGIILKERSGPKPLRKVNPLYPHGIPSMIPSIPNENKIPKQVNLDGSKHKSNSSSNGPSLDVQSSPTALSSSLSHQTCKTDKPPTSYHYKPPKKFPCLICHQVFYRSHNLKSHMLVHTGEKSMKCGICGLAFSRPHDLKRHQRTHGLTNKFACEYCGKEFSRSDALQRHLKKAENGKSSCIGMDKAVKVQSKKSIVTVETSSLSRNKESLQKDDQEMDNSFNPHLTPTSSSTSTILSAHSGITECEEWNTREFSIQDITTRSESDLPLMTTSLLAGFSESHNDGSKANGKKSDVNIPAFYPSPSSFFKPAVHSTPTLPTDEIQTASSRAHLGDFSSLVCLLEENREDMEVMCPDIYPATSLPQSTQYIRPIFSDGENNAAAQDVFSLMQRNKLLESKMAIMLEELERQKEARGRVELKVRELELEKNLLRSILDEKSVAKINLMMPADLVNSLGDCPDDALFSRQGVTPKPASAKSGAFNPSSSFSTSDEAIPMESSPPAHNILHELFSEEAFRQLFASPLRSDSR